MSNIKLIDNQLENLECEIMSGYLDGIDMNKLTAIICEKVSRDLIEDITELISEIIDDMAMIVKVSYKQKCNTFVLDFRVDDVGSIVRLNLQEILQYKYTYQKSIEDSLIATLLYTLVQKKTPSVLIA